MLRKKGKFKEILIIGVVLFAVSYLIIGTADTATMFGVGVVVFFIGFNMHEPIMQSLATKFAKVHQRGFTLAIFNSFGYLGTFLGGILGGVFYESVSLNDIVMVIAVICVLWAILIFTIPNPLKKKNLYISLKEINKEKLKSLHDIEAIDEWYINNTQDIAIVKYDQDKLSEEALKKVLK